MEHPSTENAGQQPRIDGTDAQPTRAAIRLAGGWLGIAESVIPGLLFLVLFVATSKNLPVSIGVSVASSLVFFAIRALRREKFQSAIIGLVALLASAALALFTGRGENFFLVGFLINAVAAIACIATVLLRRPLVGEFASVIIPTFDRGWRDDTDLRRGFSWLTLGWAAFFALRLLVEVPLYLASATVGLGTARIVLGTPAYAVCVALTVVVAKGMVARHAASSEKSHTLDT